MRALLRIIGLAAKTFGLIMLLGLSGISYAQKKPAANSQKKGTNQTKPQEVTFYYKSWESGEVKECETHASEYGLVLCDEHDVKWKESVFHRKVAYAFAGFSLEESQKKALDDARMSGKHFLATFTEEPWTTGKPWKTWRCSKKEVVSCTVDLRMEEPK